MQVHDGELPRARQLARTGKELSREARSRLAWMDFFGRSKNVARTCRHFGISRFYRWQRRYDPQNLATLEPRSHRPHRHRRPTWSSALADRALALRLRYPRWGKDKLAVLLRQQKLTVSTSMVGRILTQLKRQGGWSKHPVAVCRAGAAPLRSRPYAIRKPKQYAVSQPGDLVASRYPRRASPARRGLQTVHRPRCGLALGRDSGSHSRHRFHRCPVPRYLAAPHAPSGSRRASRWRQRVRRRVRSRLSTARPALVRARPHVLPNSTARSNAPTAPTPRSSTKSPSAPWR